MSYAKVPVKMKAADEENQKQGKKARKKPIEPAAKPSAEKSFSNELNEPRWSVVSFEKSLASGLTYEQAVKELEKAAAQKVSGLCIITDEAAQKISDKSK